MKKRYYKLTVNGRPFSKRILGLAAARAALKKEHFVRGVLGGIVRVQA